MCFVDILHGSWTERGVDQKGARHPNLFLKLALINITHMR